MVPTPFGLDLFAIMPAPAAAGTLANDYLDAIYAYWYTDPALTTAFPGTDGLGADAFKVDESNYGCPLPRAVVVEIGSRDTETPSGSRIEHPAVQFSVYADNYEDARRLGYLVQETYHKRTLAFGNGYQMAGVARPLKTMNSGPGPGAAEVYQTVFDAQYTIGRYI
jgi:hypothetical protein